MTKEFMSSPNLPPAATYSQVVKAGNTIYVAGQVGAGSDGKTVEGGFRAQAEKAFENLSLALAAAGASTKDVVKLNIYVTDMSDRPLLAEARSRYFSAPLPASTLVQISALALPEYLIEVEAVAVLD